MSDAAVMEGVRRVGAIQGQWYAIKSRHSANQSAVKLLENEFVCLSRAKSQYTPDARRLWSKKGTTYMLMTGVKGARFDRCLPDLSEHELFRVLRQVAEGIQYCHAKQVNVNELRIDSIIVPGLRPAQITDFSKAQLQNRVYGLDDTEYYDNLDMRYAAEEQRSNENNKETDSWHLGVLAYLALTSRIMDVNLDAIEPINEEFSSGEGENKLSWWRINSEPIASVLNFFPPGVGLLERLLGKTLIKGQFGIRPSIQDHIDTYAHYETFYQNNGNKLF